MDFGVWGAGFLPPATGSEIFKVKRFGVCRFVERVEFGVCSEKPEIHKILKRLEALTMNPKPSHPKPCTQTCPSKNSETLNLESKTRKVEA